MLSAERDGSNKLENKHQWPKPTTRQSLYCTWNNSLLQVPTRPRTRSKSGALGDMGSSLNKQPDESCAPHQAQSRRNELTRRNGLLITAA